MGLHLAKITISYYSMSEEQPKAEAPAQATALSNKELKELKKKEKAAKRAAQKEAAGITPEQQQQLAQQKMEKKKLQATNTNLKKQLSQAVVKDDAKKIPALFSHLESREQRYSASPTVSHIVHPAILTLSLHFSNHKIVGSTARLREMLKVFQQVIGDYQTPENTTLTRHLTGHLSHQIEYLKSSRPLSTSMGNAIRWLKQEISHISIDTPEQEAKNALCELIALFIREKIDLSDQLIIESASQHITNGCTVLTYGHLEVLRKLFQHCVVEQKKTFNLVVVDSRPLFEGKKLLQELVETDLEPQPTSDSKYSLSDALSVSTDSVDRSDAPLLRKVASVPITRDRLKVNYVLLSLLSATALEDVDIAFLGAHAMLSNGHLYSRVGTAMIAMMCHRRSIPVLTCCESIKFLDRVQLDSVTTNELSDPEELACSTKLKVPPKRSLALEQFLELQKPESQEKPRDKKADKDQNVEPLRDWKKVPQLSILNIMYDLTPPTYINKVVTELGSLPPSSVPVILREYKST